jgi:hypothetical protein
MKLKQITEVVELINKQDKKIENLFKELKKNNDILKSLETQIEILNKFINTPLDVSYNSDETLWEKEQTEEKEQSTIDYLYAN